MAITVYPIRQFGGRAYLVLAEPVLIDRPQTVPVIDLGGIEYTPADHTFPGLPADYGDGPYATVALAPGVRPLPMRITDLAVRLGFATPHETADLQEEVLA